jgi:hypothetical protein
LIFVPHLRGSRARYFLALAALPNVVLDRLRLSAFRDAPRTVSKPGFDALAESIAGLGKSLKKRREKPLFRGS